VPSAGHQPAITLLVVQLTGHSTTRPPTRSAAALLPAAGAGSRLGAIGRRLPKGLLRVGKETLLGHMVTRLRRLGVDDIFVVTGHRASAVRAELGESVGYFHNAAYATSGILDSVLRARAHLAGRRFIVSAADNYASPALLQRCLEADADVVSAVRRSAGSIPVTTRSGHLIRTRAEDVAGEVGEYCGISVLSPEASAIFFERARALSRSGGLIVDVIAAIGNGRLAGEIVWCGDDEWSDVDTIADLARVRSLAARGN